MLITNREISSEEFRDWVDEVCAEAANGDVPYQNTRIARRIYFKIKNRENFGKRKNLFQE